LPQVRLNPEVRTIVCTAEPRRWTAIPIAIESKLPVQLAPELDIIGRVQVEVNSARFRNGRK
jgi:hypothetical protein